MFTTRLRRSLNIFVLQLYYGHTIQTVSNARIIARGGRTAPGVSGLVRLVDIQHPGKFVSRLYCIVGRCRTGGAKGPNILQQTGQALCVKSLGSLAWILAPQ